MSCNRTVVFTTSDSAYPASARMAEMFSSARCVCASMPSAIRPVAASMGNCPDTYNVVPAAIACE